MSMADEVLARARLALAGTEPVGKVFRVLPKDVPTPRPRTNYGEGHSRDADKFVVRMPDDMRERMARVARLHFRSMNSEVLVALDWWMDRQTLMWLMLQATERELALQESLNNAAIETTLDLLAQRHPKAAETIKQLRAQLYAG